MTNGNDILEWEEANRERLVEEFIEEKKEKYARFIEDMEEFFVHTYEEEYHRFVEQDYAESGGRGE